MYCVRRGLLKHYCLKKWVSCALLGILIQVGAIIRIARDAGRAIPAQARSACSKHLFIDGQVYRRTIVQVLQTHEYLDLHMFVQGVSASEKSLGNLVSVYSSSFEWHYPCFICVP
jgi:hypothetical protein